VYTHRSGARQRLGSGAPGSRVQHCREWASPLRPPPPTTTTLKIVTL